MAEMRLRVAPDNGTRERMTPRGHLTVCRLSLADIAVYNNVWMNALTFMKNVTRKKTLLLFSDTFVIA